jgi:hypothetical protein
MITIQGVEELVHSRLEVDETVVETAQRLTIDQKHAGTLVWAQCRIKGDFDPGAEIIEVPHAVRRSAEAGIETVARLFALDYRTGYSISSPMPYVGFQCEDDRVLGPLVGKRVENPVISGVGPVATGRSNIFRDDVIAGLSDRLDGLALLGEALSSPNALGRYLEIVRLLERAFGSKAGGLVQYLVPFLTDPSCVHAFTKKEVHTWIEVRPKVMHADSRLEFLLEADVRPWIGRMLEAAYDVLLNKRDWRSPTSERRNLWEPVAGSSAENATFLTQGKAASVTVQLLDGFGAYPLVLAGPFESLLPPGVWLMGDADGGALQRSEGIT